ncbi:MAG: glycerophosphodiester phosphodiesterase family protein [Bacteroidia bacterium]|nr:glycerophosphodiester phosphodiesterase family protein [Bacteroidia bacterium]
MKNLLFAFLFIPLAFFSCKTSSSFVKASKEGLPEKVTYGKAGLPVVSAHRGGRYYAGFPENSIELFAYTASQVKTIIECDVSMSKDSILLLMHDNSLDRTTTGKGKVKEKSWSDMEALYLKDDLGTVTTFRVPELDDVLKWGKNKVWFTLDVKRGVPFSMVVDAIHKRNAAGYAAIITYNLDAAKEVHALDSNLLISVGIRNMEDLERYKKSGIPLKNLIAFTGTREPKAELYQALHEEGIVCLLGTLGNLDRQAKAKGDHLYKKFRKAGADILATDRPLEAYKALQSEAAKTKSQKN